MLFRSYRSQSQRRNICLNQCRNKHSNNDTRFMTPPHGFIPKTKLLSLKSVSLSLLRQTNQILEIVFSSVPLHKLICLNIPSLIFLNDQQSSLISTTGAEADLLNFINVWLNKAPRIFRTCSTSYKRSVIFLPYDSESLCFSLSCFSLLAQIFI